MKDAKWKGTWEQTSRIPLEPAEEQGRSAPSGVCAMSRGRKAGGLRNRDEMVGTGPEIWRTDTMGLGCGPQGSNLFPQAGRFSSSRKIYKRTDDKKGAKTDSPQMLQLRPVLLTGETLPG